MSSISEQLTDGVKKRLESDFWLYFIGSWVYHNYKLLIIIFYHNKEDYEALYKVIHTYVYTNGLSELLIIPFLMALFISVITSFLLQISPITKAYATNRALRILDALNDNLPSQAHFQERLKELTDLKSIHHAEMKKYADERIEIEERLSRKITSFDEAIKLPWTEDSIGVQVLNIYFEAIKKASGGVESVHYLKNHLMQHLSTDDINQLDPMLNGLIKLGYIIRSEKHEGRFRMTQVGFDRLKIREYLAIEEARDERRKATEHWLQKDISPLNFFRRFKKTNSI